MSDDAPSNIQDVDAGTPAPSGDEIVRTAGLHQMAKSDDATDYVQEKRDQNAEAKGEDIAAQPTKRAARAERYRRAVNSALEHVSEKQNASAPESRTLAEAVGADVSGNANAESQEQFAARVRDQTRIETQYAMRAQDYFRKNPDAQSDLAMLEYFQPAQHVAETVLKSEYGPALAHELTKFPEAIYELNDMPAAEAARVLGIVEGRLRAQEAYADQMQPSGGYRRATHAPAPMSMVRGGASPTADLNALAKSDNVDGYINARRAQQRANAR